LSATKVSDNKIEDLIGEIVVRLEEALKLGAATFEEYYRR